jgi:hypothetical protein
MLSEGLSQGANLVTEVKAIARSMNEEAKVMKISGTPRARRKASRLL